MQLYIHKESGVVAKDGEGYLGIDLSSLDTNIIGLQWNGKKGFISHDDYTSEQIENVDDFLYLIPLWEIAKRKAHQPEPYFIWDDSNNEWKEDPIQKKQYLIDQQVSSYKVFLNSTDWYYARKAETGEDIPTDIVLKRKEARDYIVANS